MNVQRVPRTHSCSALPEAVHDSRALHSSFGYVVFMLHSRFAPRYGFNKILEETIQKKTPRALYPKVKSVKDAEKYRMSFAIPERVTENLFQYRTKFVQHMLSSTMYANSAIGKPWEKIGSVSEQIIDELLLSCAKEMELQEFIQNLYKNETC